MNNEYVIVNKTALLKMREELIHVSDYQRGQMDLIDAIVSSQSTPLIPEINAAIEFGKDIIGSNTFISTDENGTPFIDYFDTTTETNHYISNLKFDI
jgi:hypothetical protein